MTHSTRTMPIRLHPLPRTLCWSLLAAATAAGCADGGDTIDEDALAPQIAVAGQWNPPQSVRSAGAAEFIAYEGPPAWDGGAHCGGRLLDGTRELGDFLKQQFPGRVSSYGGYDCRPNTANASETSVHGTGRALDVFIPMAGGDADNTKGDEVANWLIVNAQAIGVQYIIWDHADWSGAHGGDKMGNYGGPIPHIDHIHVEINHAGAARTTPWFHGHGSVNHDTHIAFQANTGSLWTTGTAGSHDWQLGLAAGTSPSIAGLPSGGFQVAFQANTGELWTTGTSGTNNLHLGMMAGTSPSIAGLVGGGYQIAFQANTGSLWTTGTAGTHNWDLGLMAGTSPSITALAGGGFEIAFQSNTGELWTAGDAGLRNWHLGLRSGTSPSIAGLTGGGFQVAFQANTGALWTVGSADNGDRQLGMADGTSPSITALSNGGYQIAIQANTGSLWTAGTNGTHDWQLGLMHGSSPSIQALANGKFLVTFQANTGSLWKAGDDGIADLQLGLAAPTSPSAN